MIRRQEHTRTGHDRTVRTHRFCRCVANAFAVGLWLHRVGKSDGIALATFANAPTFLPTCHDTHRVGKSGTVASTKVAVVS